MTPLLSRSPREMLLVDSIGAFASAFMIGIILSIFHEFIGLPVATLRFLAKIAAVFCMYSATCYLIPSINHRIYLSLIAIANIIYCALTISVVKVSLEQITTVGLVYFTGEVLIIAVLVVIELRSVFRK